MSASMHWEPYKKSPKRLPDELKYILRNLFERERVFDDGDLAYLRGLSDAKIKGADALIAAIEKYERVRVWLEY